MDEFFLDDKPKRKNVQKNIKRKSRADENNSGDDLDMDGSVLGDRSDAASDSNDDEIKETAAQKRLRLAKSYLSKVREEVEGDDNDEIDAEKIDQDLIAARLRFDVLETTGKHFRQIADSYKDIDASNIAYLILHSGNKRKGHQLSVTCVAFAEPKLSTLLAQPTDLQTNTQISVSLLSNTFTNPNSKEPANQYNQTSNSSPLYLYSGSKDGSIVKWNLTTGQRAFFVPGGIKNTKKIRTVVGENALKRQLGHTDNVLCMDVSSDSKYLVTGGRDKLIYVWSVADNKRIGSFKQHRDSISGLTFRKGTNQLYSSSFDRTVKLWNVEEMSYVETLFGHQDQITSIHTLTKERCITAGARDRTVRLWKILEESQLVFRGGGTGGSTSILEEFANPTDERKLKSNSIATCIDVVAMLDEENWLSGSDAGTISLWNITKKKPVYTRVNAHGNNGDSLMECRWITSLSTIPYSDLFASGACDGFVKLWKVSDTKRNFNQILAIPINGFINSLSLFEHHILLDNTDIPAIERKKKKSGYLYLAIGVGQEHRLGRWWRIKEAKNVAIMASNQTANQQLRQAQINSLHSHGLSVRELRRNTEFEIPFVTHSDGRSANLSLILMLPIDFPERSPSISVRPVLAHSWVNPQSGLLTGHDKLGQRWSQHNNIGKLIKEIIQEFQIRNPQRFMNNSYPTSSISSGSTPPTYSANPLRSLNMSPPLVPPSPPKNQISPPQVKKSGTQSEITLPLPPSINTEFPGFENKTIEDLELLLSDDSLFKEYFESIPNVKASLNLRRELKLGNVAAAKRNLEKEQELIAVKSSLQERFEILRNQKEKFDQLVENQQNELMRFSPDYIVNKLRASITDSEEVSESLETSFKEKNIDLDDFIKQYRAVRKVYHIRAAKLERVMHSHQSFIHY
ncbi:pre-rRNA processing protein [Nowakowskiella sp. JEL0078]|nr:pre-rRNA processing protein [Nowakowskiella sp. JEL0078]